MGHETPDRSVIAWLLDSDPAIRWQVMRDLLDAPEEQWQAERRRVEHDGWGARLFSHQDADGQWAGGGFFPADFSEALWHQEGQPWTATCWALQQLREFGLDPTTERARITMELIAEHSRWDHDNQPYWEGEVEECINGRTVADASYFGVDASPIVARLITEQLDDGGWNCERERGSVRGSFHTTISVIEGLLECERATGGTVASREARRRGEEYLLERRLFRRLSTGEVADPGFLEFVYPWRWRYDVLRGLAYFRDAAILTGAPPDDRLGEAIERVRAKRQGGRWLLDHRPSGRVWFHLDSAVSEPSLWITLHAWRVLKWWENHP